MEWNESTIEWKKGTIQWNSSLWKRVIARDEVAPQALMGLFGGTQIKTNKEEFSAECHSVDCSSDSKV